MVKTAHERNEKINIRINEYSLRSKERETDGLVKEKEQDHCKENKQYPEAQSRPGAQQTSDDSVSRH